MESSQWNKLSYDLEIPILTRLPILDLRRLSLTCKYFHSILLDPSFAIHYDRSFLGRPMLCLMSDLLDERMDFPFFRSIIWQGERPAMFTWQNPWLHDLREYQWRSLTYGDGLMCFEGFVGPISFENIFPEKTKLLVFNPLFSQERRILSLPAMTNSVSRIYTGIALDRKNGVCKLILWHRSEAFNFTVTTFVYNFKESMWKKIPEWNGIPNYRGSLYFQHRPQLVNERFLCWLVHSTDSISLVNMVLVFDVEEEMWREPIPFPPIPLGYRLFICIVEHKKRLCMISETSQKEKDNTILVTWEFHMEERVWRLAESIPPPPFRFQDALGPEMGGRGFWGVEHGDFAERHVHIYDMSHHSWQNIGEFQPTIMFEPSLFRLVT